MSPLQAAKLYLVDHVDLAKDALHIYVGLTLFFASMLVMRWKPHQWKPWLVVAAMAVAGEVWDLRDSRVYGTPVELSRNWHDVWNTLFWPTMILLLARSTSLFAVSSRAQDAASQSGQG